jgi:hypothetical protein
MIAASAIERLSGHGPGQFAALEPLPGRGGFASLQDDPPDALSDMIWMGVHRPHPGRVASRVQQGGVAPGRMVAAEQGGATAPTAAPGQDALVLHDEIGAVDDQLAVQAHDVE